MAKATQQSTYTQEIAIFLCICLFRLLNTLMVQSYFDPDEFWQSNEPAYCHVFGQNPSRSTFDCPGFTWEWKRRASEEASDNFIEQSMHGPARTHLSIVPVWIFYHVLKTLQVDEWLYVARGPMWLYALTVAAPTDYAIWYVAKWLPLPSEQENQQQLITNARNTQRWCLFCSLTSWFSAFSMVRTFANAQETMLIMLSLSLVSPEFVESTRKNGFVWRSSVAFFFGGLAASIRFTALAIYIPMGIVLALQRPTWKQQVGFLLFPCAILGAAGIFLAMIVDKAFFGFWTIPFLANFHFNVILNYANLFGSHPWHWYFTTAFFVVVGTLIPFVLADVSRLLPSKNNTKQQGYFNLWVVFLSYMIVMSFNSHKEFRYILPILPISCLLAGRKVASVSSNHKLLRYIILGTIILLNFFVLAYSGLFHQSGPISVNQRIVQDANARFSETGVTNFSIHYLTGSCHSTPLHSHLHNPPLQFTTTTLDCSPSCRADPKLECETDQFRNDPLSFLQHLLSKEEESDAADMERQCSSDEEQSCSANLDYIVTMSEYTSFFESQSLFDVKEIARFPHNINGAEVFGMELGNFKHGDIPFFAMSNWLKLGLDEVVLLRVDQTSKSDPV